ncbi:NAD(P)H-dependent FMN reductase [Saccharothrix carnea]|uniref:NAD(P)H-dependent FMN reductase n=1 Tax=Saccharothrix carnea TaxID=1280637 RepID=A0A2P8I2K3_SACCR|nr:NAD(P)H-dependent oxidoreductase [Saccharothrix carnea]PSL52691.1 NAD(P)H-dependent FMN reductase [Saccharothrix carnea]
MVNEPIRLAVIMGSTRAGRFAPTVTRWFVAQAEARQDVVVSLVDLAEAKLPEVLGIPGQDVVSELGDVLDAADAFVVVTPEYNHSFPAALKTAVDWYFDEWAAKPVGFVSYGGRGGGLRAVEHLRQVFAEVNAVTIREAVSFHGAWRSFDADGSPRDPAECNAAAKSMLDQLSWWAVSLAEARAKRPFRA